MTTTIKLADVVDAVDFLSWDGGFSGHYAFIRKSDGRLFFDADHGDFEPLPDDIEDGSLYIAIPDKREFDLGRELVFQFVEEFLPNEAELALLRARGVSLPLSKLTVIKKGKNGATALMADRELHAAAAPSRIVDTTGAGDAFNAAFLSAWLAGRPIEDCLAAGNKRGAEAIAHRGGLGGLSSSVSLQNVH